MSPHDFGLLASRLAGSLCHPKIVLLQFSCSTILSHLSQHLLCICSNILLNVEGQIQYLYIPLHTFTYLYIPLHTFTYLYIPLHTFTYLYLYIPLHTFTYLYIPLHTFTNTFTYSDSKIMPMLKFIINVIPVVLQFP